MVLRRPIWAPCALFSSMAALVSWMSVGSVVGDDNVGGARYFQATFIYHADGGDERAGVGEGDARTLGVVGNVGRGLNERGAAGETPHV